MINKIINRILGVSNFMYLKSFFPGRTEKERIRKRKLFYSQFLRENSIYYDVGANFGNRIEPIINMGLKIVAVEPQKICIKYLRRKYGRRIVIVPKGLGEKEEEKTMFISDAHTISSFSKEWVEATKESGRFSQYNWNETRRISMTTLEHLISEHGLPDFVKIDVEGFEYEVLKGLSRPVKVISFEYSVPENIDLAIKCIRRIREVFGNKVIFNYSVGESMEWKLGNWISYEEAIGVIDSASFIRSSFGDFYAKYTGK